MTHTPLLKDKEDLNKLPKMYDPKLTEAIIYENWEKSGYFKPSGTGKPYCIMIPPPNITGHLHMGHGFQNTLMDILIRYHRMLGKHTLWQMGTDHAGIATQMVVERRLNQAGKTRKDLGREAFIQEIWKWKDHAKSHITQQIRRLGASVDWETEHFTLDPTLSQAVNTVFIKLYEEGLIYKGKRLVNWDPTLQTAISDLEVVNQEESGQIWFIRFPFADKSGFLTIATTRPETLLGDTAVAVHPEDIRYQKHIGSFIKLPLTGRRIPIVADDTIDQSFGTGCVKITPAHDANDYALGLRHNLPQISILTKDGKINTHAPQAYQGLDRFEARQRIIEDLKQQGLLDSVKSHQMMIPRGDRSGAIIEPYLTEQWFIKAKPLAKPAIEAVRSGKVKLKPKHWEKTYFHWMEHIEDWCISRQLWWGHRIPAWYDEKGKIYVGESAEAVRKKNHLSSDQILTQDPDVLDTWFSSALWPFSALGWPKQTERLKTFYSTDCLVTGFDILFFWVARMLMMGLKFTGKIPFKDVYITGLIRDHQGQKMSKSKGNTLDPIDLVDGISLEKLIEKRTQSLMQPHLIQAIIKNTKSEFPQGIQAHGVDALRFTYCLLASQNRDLRFDLNRLASSRHFCNKLWNAGRYLLHAIDNKEDITLLPQHDLPFAEQWIQGKLKETIKKAQHALAHYRFDWLADLLYDFVWHDFCDWYLELTKVNLSTSCHHTQYSTKYTLLKVYEILLRLLHPITPFITEALWKYIKPLLNKSGHIMVESYPQATDLTTINEAIQDEFNLFKQAVTQIRTLRAELGVSPSTKLTLYFESHDKKASACLIRHQPYFQALAKLSNIEAVTRTTHFSSQTPTLLLGSLKCYLPIPKNASSPQHYQRLVKTIEKLEKDLSSLMTRLNNPDYLSKAPKAIIDKTQSQAHALEKSLKKYKDQRDTWDDCP